MNQFTFQRLCVAALFGALLIVSANPAARGEDWSGWMGKSKNPNEFESQLSMARLNERHGQHDSAIKIYNAVLEKQPNNQLAHHRLAIIAAGNGDYVAADQHFSNALKAGPRTPDLMCDVGYCLFLQNRLDESEEALRRILTEAPTHKKAHNTLGMVLGLQGRYEESLNEFRQAVGEAEAHANLGFVLVQVGDFKEANKHYHEAVRLNPALRPAVEALVELNGYAPKGPEKGALKPAPSASKGSTVTASAKAKTSPIAKPALSRQATFTPQQPPSQQVSAPKTKGMAGDTKSEPAKIADSHQEGHADVSSNADIARQLTPQTPVVPKQSANSFAPAIAGLSKNDRLRPGPRSSSSAHSEMMAKHGQKAPKAAELVIPVMDSNMASSSEGFADAPVPNQQETPLVASIASKPAATEMPNSSFSPKVTRAQVINYEVPQNERVAAYAEAGEEFNDSSVVEISDESSVTDATVVITPGFSALAAARAQADLLTAQSITASDMADQIPADYSDTNSIATPATFVAASDEESLQSSDKKAVAESTTATPAMPNSLNSTTPAPWHVVLMTLGCVFGLLVLGKAAKRLVRSKTIVQALETEEPQSSEETVSPPTYQSDETYTYLENQIRDVCAGLPSAGRSAEGVRLG